MQLINLTQHIINIYLPSGEIRIVQPSGQVARVSTTEIPLSPLGDIPVAARKKGRAEGIPDPQEGVAYIVSGMVLEAVPERSDVFAPGALLRGPDGQPVGCQGLVGNESRSAVPWNVLAKHAVAGDGDAAEELLFQLGYGWLLAT